MVEGKQLRCNKYTDSGSLSLVAKLVVPVAMSLVVSGCVSTETSFLPTDADIQLAQQNSLNSEENQTNSELALTEVQEGGVPIPDNRNKTIVAAYSPATAENSLASSVSQQETPSQILAGGIVGNAGNSAVLPVNAVANPADASTEPAVANAGNQTSLVAASISTKKQSSFFSRLFKPAEPKPTTPIKTTQNPPAVEQQFASLTPALSEPKKQITEATEVAKAAITPLPKKPTTKKRTNVFTSLFGLKSGTDEDGTPEKTVKLASASIGGLARLSPLALQRQTERVDVACLKPELVRLLKKVEAYYKRPVVVTSGYRSPKSNKRIGGATGSKHTTCEAADVQVKGVSKWDIAKYVRSLPERGGVGTYCHTQSVHIDIGSARDWNWRCRKRRK